MDDDGGYPYFRAAPYSADLSGSPHQAMDLPFGESLSAVAFTSSSMRALASAEDDGDSRAVHYGRCSKLNPNMATHSGVLHQYFFIAAYTVYHLEIHDVICNQQRY